MSEKDKELIVIVGPTAVGKTSFAVEMANKIDTHIIGADARQFYKEMSIGTARPTEEEMQGVPHHFVGHISVEQPYNAGNFEKDVLAKLEILFERNDQVIMVGGSGLFVNAVCFGLDDIPNVPATIRQEVTAQYELEGLESIVESIDKLSDEGVSHLETGNPHRMMRALEVLIHTGKTIQYFQNKPKESRQFKTTFIGLNRNREELYNRINRRVDIMMTNGLKEEVEALKEYKHLTALKTVGYQEFYEAEENGMTEAEVIERIKQSSRRYAKRQLTWFKKLPNVNWIHPETKENIDV
jgi:tRNA dimethylallyltransferase